MPVEFDESSRDEQPVDEMLPGPDAHRRRRWVTIACAGVAAALLAGGAVAVAESSTSSSLRLAAAASSSSASANPTASPSGHPNGKGGRGPLLPKSLKPILFGSVKSSSGDTILITDFEGFTRTIVTSSKTVYKNGLTADPKAGTKIVAQGTVDKNGTSLDATLITTLPTLGGRGGLPHLGLPFGGPGGFGGPNGSRPSSFPTGARPSGYPTWHPGGPQHPTSPAPTSTATA